LQQNVHIANNEHRGFKLFWLLFLFWSS